MSRKLKLDMQTAKLTSKGQLTVPVEVRNFLSLSPGDSINFTFEHNSVQIKKAEPFDIEYHRALESTLNAEWNSKEDNDAYKHL